MMRPITLGTLALVVVVLLTAPQLPGQLQSHTTLQHGDILAGGQTPSVGPVSSRFDWYLPDGTLNLRLGGSLSEVPFDVALDPTHRSYWPTGYTIRVYDRAGNRIDGFPQFPFVASAITFDGLGNAYAYAVGLAKITPTGTLVTTFDLPVDGAGLVRGLDLAADQCTLYYTSGGTRLFRYDLCQRKALPDLNAALPGPRAGPLRILPDGGALVADDEFVLRLSPAGTVVAVYDVAGENRWRALALDVDQSSFWATSRDLAFKFDIASGAILTSFQAAKIEEACLSCSYWFTAFAVVGEPRAAAVAANIPALSPLWLVALALGLAVVACVRLGSFGG